MKGINDSLFVCFLYSTIFVLLRPLEDNVSFPSADAFSFSFSFSTSARSSLQRSPACLLTATRKESALDDESYRPIPAMPSDLFQQLALSQLELLANSMPSMDNEGKVKSKIKSMALYLPQENVNTGQLEFTPSVIYPHPSSERIFIANEADSGVAPTLPRLLTKLPGFAAPNSLLPRYPMVSTSPEGSLPGADLAGVGVVEEVLCDVRSGAAALSVPLFLGTQTVGVLLVSPNVPPEKKASQKSVWAKDDHEQLARAARTLSVALNMDMERRNLEIQNQKVQNALSDSLHQVKNPLQALRTFGKLLQRRVASTEGNSVPMVGTLQLLELTQNLMEQSDRVVNLLAPMDSLVDSLDSRNNRTETRALLYLNPARTTASGESQSLVPWGQANNPLLPWEAETLDFARRETPRKTKVSSATGSSEKKDRQTNNASGNSTIEFSRPGAGARGSSSTAAAKSDISSQPPSAATSPSVVGDDDEIEMGFIVDVLEPILSAYKAIAEERRINFEVIGMEDADEFPGVQIRRKALQEAFSNILDNAFKYVALPWTTKQDVSDSRRNSAPFVRVQLLPNDDEVPVGVTIFVEDNGPGVPSAETEAVFERGFRSSSVSSLAPGTGIGLDISRSLLESMGGKLECVAKHQRKHERNIFLDGALFKLTLFRNTS